MLQRYGNAFHDYAAAVAYSVRNAQASNHCLWTGLYPDELLSRGASSLRAQWAMSSTAHNIMHATHGAGIMALSRRKLVHVSAICLLTRKGCECLGRSWWEIDGSMLTSSSFSSRNLTTGSLVMALSTMRWHSSVLMPLGFLSGSSTSDDMYPWYLRAAGDGQ